MNFPNRLPGGEAVNADSLTDLQRRIQLFLGTAEAAAPPQSIENGENEDESATMVEVNLILGVLEAKPKRDIIIPSEESRAALDDEEESEAEAFAQLTRALMPTSQEQGAETSSDDDNDEDQ